MSNNVLTQATSLLQKHQYTVSCAESCTGGLLAAALTEQAGSSAWFNMGFVTYSNEAKQQLLGVTAATLRADGAVSAACVIEMANGTLAAANADFALSISGIAGPGGGSAAKPVGMVWFGLAQRHQQAQAHTRTFQGNREQVREQAVLFALSWLTDAINNIHSK